MEPLEEYESRRALWLARQSILARQFIRLGNARLTVALTGALLAWLVFSPRLLSAWWLLVPLGVFLALVVWHARVIRHAAFAARGLRYYQGGLDRLHNQWQGKGEPGERFRDPNHVYSEDLDLFGKGSLFELLSTVRTAAGEDTLAAWLLHPAIPAEAAARQEAVRELSTRLDLREEIVLLGEDVRSGVRAETIMRWAAQPPVPFHPLLRPLSLLLSIGAVVCGLGGLFQLLPGWPLASILAVNIVIIYSNRKSVSQILGAVDLPANHLAILALLMQRIEMEKFASPLLRNLLARLQVAGKPAAAQIRRFERLIDLLGVSSNQLMVVIVFLLLWREQIAFAIEMWRREVASHLGEWIQVLGEFEALSALAALTFERPAWAFPEFLPESPALFDAQSLRHPLLAQSRSVPNNVALHEAPRLFIVSGSNMSGKSTLLRSIGLNTVLAWAGAPVNAGRLRISPLQTGASIRVLDSLQDNRSRFFAEITRLRQIIDLTRGTTPVLFLLDELLSGTNSHDRRIGAAGLVKALLRANTIGLLTTHDLALTEIANDVGALASNVHFEDRITAGQVEFDYRLRPGLVTHSNALELMRAVGLDV